MKVLIILAAVLAIVSAQAGYKPDTIYVPIPYSFNYISNTEDGGSSGHQESGDGSGTVRGSYTVSNLEGHTRVVEYVAGPEGFNAVVRTNEPGTDNSNPADVVVESSAAEAKPPAGGQGAPRGTPSTGGGAGAGGRPNVRYVLVPSTDARARRQ